MLGKSGLLRMGILIILLLMTVCIFYSCTKTADPYAASDYPPQVYFIQNGNDVTETFDSVKLINGTNTIDLNFTYLASDTSSLRFTLSVTPDGTASRNGHEIQYTGTTVGIKTVLVTVTDLYNKTGTATANLTFFKTLVPVAELTVTKDPDIPYAVILNASGSYAPDQKFGGALASYTFSQPNSGEPSVTGTNSTITWMVNKSGTYTFDCTVQNIDGVNSQVISVQFTY
jgi:hypothetical protein